MDAGGSNHPDTLPGHCDSRGEPGRTRLANNAYSGSLDALIRAEVERAQPPNTRTAYERAVSMFRSWCSTKGFEPVPTWSATLAAYVLYLRHQGLAPATISQHIGAIRAMNKAEGYPGEPNTYQASVLLRKYRRDLAEAGQGQRQAVPVTPAVLRRMVGTLDVTTLAGQRDRLALVLGFCGMLRRSELVGLWARDVTVTDEGVTLLVRTSKTDKESQGRHVPIPPQADPDPVTLTQQWLTLVGSGPLLRRVTRSDELTDLPWRAAGVCDLVKRCAAELNLPNADRYTAHSLRAGGLTASLRNGTPLGVAARHGGWNPESAVPARYARVADQWRDNAMRGVL